MADTTVLSSRAQDAVKATVAASALAIERRIAVARAVFYGAILVRIALTEQITLHAVLADSTLVVGIVFSVYVLWRVRTPPNGAWFWVLSVALDALAAHGTLSQETLWPRPGYEGILALPETSGILIATVASGLRLSLAAALCGGGANVAGLTILLLLDRAVSGHRVTNDAKAAAIYFIFIGAMTMLAAILAVTTRRLVMRAAGVALRADRAERGLGSVLADCHDARSVLNAARLNAELIQRGVPAHERAPCGGLNLVADRLLNNLSQVETLVLGVGSRALSDLSAAQPPVAVPLDRLINRVAEQARLQFAGLRIECERAPATLAAWVCGGELALHRVLTNLLTNACEGDGLRRAKVVKLSLEQAADGSAVTVRVTDDGPGIQSAGQLTPSKLTSSGVGLRVVRGITEASGGRFRAAMRPEGGTVASVTLLTAPAKPSAAKPADGEAP
jgi:signal transduction histidine kinase